MCDGKCSEMNKVKGGSVPELLESAAATFRERSELYGDSYKDFGYMMACLFPKGLTVTTPEEWNRLGVLNMICSKLMRYCNNFHKGGHKDSMHDMQVYAAMQEELDG